MKRRLFIDMDGTLYRFHDKILDDEGHVQIEKMYDQDFFLNLDPFHNMVSAVNFMHEADFGLEIFILSSADTEDIVRQKNDCIDRDFPWLDGEHRLYPKTWENKSMVIPDGIHSSDILIDDYNKNLQNWENEKGIAIKFINNINHKGKGRYGGDINKLWEKGKIHYKSDPAEIGYQIMELIRYPDPAKNKTILEKTIATFEAWRMCEHEGKVYIVGTDYEEIEHFDYDYLQKNYDKETIQQGCYDNYATALSSWVSSIRDDIEDIGVCDENGNYNFYLSEDELAYCGLTRELEQAVAVTHDDMNYDEMEEEIEMI